MILLITHGQPTFERHAHAEIGRLIQPRETSSVEETARSGLPWAADNDCFQGLDAKLYLRMLDRIRELPGCLFVTVPDVVGDHDTTRRQFDEWLYRIGGWGLPLAFVLQDGCTSDEVPWSDCEAVFIGGTTEFKLGAQAEQLVADARERGKWVHMGRVNSEKRIAYAASIGCDSVDGTQWSRFLDTHMQRALRALRTPIQERINL